MELEYGKQYKLPDGRYCDFFECESGSLGISVYGKEPVNDDSDCIDIYVSQNSVHGG